MERRILDLSGERRSLKKARGCLRVETEDQPVLVPFDDIEAVIVHARQVSYSNEVVLALAEAGIPLIACDQAHRPVAWLWPMEGNFEQSRRMAAQLDASRALKNRLWALLVKAKVEGQARILESRGNRAGALFQMAKTVKPGDLDNIEAQAAARYFPLAFGDGFTRDSSLDGANALLNYGYTIVRSCVARYVTAVGLHPTPGLHHHNRFNAFCLIDDVMEPFRPYVDHGVLKLLAEGETEVSPSAKQSLVALLSTEVESASGFIPLSRTIENLAISLAQAFLDNKPKLTLPTPPPAKGGLTQDGALFR